MPSRKILGPLCVLALLATGLLLPTGRAAPAPPARPDVAIDEFPLPDPSSAPYAITAGPDGALWFTEESASRVGRITLAGTVTEFPLPDHSSRPMGIAAGPDGNLWFVEATGNRVGRLTPIGSLTEFPLPVPDSDPEAIVAGPDHNLWFTETRRGLGRISPRGILTEFPLPTASAGPLGITTGPDGNLWFAEHAASQVGRVTPAGNVQEYPLTAKDRTPVGIAHGPDGNLWVAERTANLVAKVSPAGQVLAEYALPDPHSSPTLLTAGPDDQIWLGANPGYLSLVARLSLTGTVTQYEVPTENSAPVGITTGPDGNLWFTENAVGKIGRISEVGYGANCPVQFADVPAGSPFYAPVLCLACRGMLAGYADGTFRPGAPVTRGQFAKLLANAAGYYITLPPGYHSFADVLPGSPFLRYVESVRVHSAMHGYACGGPGEPCDAQNRPYFRPAGWVTRGQAAQAVANAAQWSDPLPPDRQTFRDVPPGSLWWAAVERGALHGILHGYADGTYRPDALVTRGQAAQLLAGAFLPGCTPPGGSAPVTVRPPGRAVAGCPPAPRGRRATAVLVPPRPAML